MKKLLFIQNFASKHYSGDGISSFSIAAYEASRQLGLEFHINVPPICDDETVEREDVHDHVVGIYRNPFSREVLIGYHQLIDVIRKEKIDFIHCNTPIGGVLGRICGHKCKVKKIIYEAHGFHFYKGAPIKNWIIYYPIEKFLAHWTDAIITINQEDYQLARNKFHLRKHGKVYYVPGVGIDLTDYKKKSVNNRQKLRNSLGLKNSDVVCISAGDLIPRKNYETAIRAIAKCHDKNIHYLICGSGQELDHLRKLTESLHNSDQVHFLGYRTDVKELFQASDIFLFTTFQEGMPRSMMEAMASGLPCIASNIRGNIDLLEDGKGGFLVPATDEDMVAEKIEILASNENLRLDMGNANLDRIQSFNINTIERLTEKIYTAELIGGGNRVTEDDLNVLHSFYPLWFKKRVELGIPASAFLIITVGRLDANKNVGTIIKALDQLNKSMAHVIVCGDGEEMVNLKAQIKENHLQQQIHLLGSRTDMKELYQASNCFALASYREGLSRSVMEAMACGLPCVVSHIRGNVDLISDGEEGYLCDPHKPEEFAKAIRILAENSDIAKRMSMSCRKKVEQFNVSRVEQRIKSIYKTEIMS